MNSPAPATLVIATRNAHKVDEIRAILGDRFRYLILNDFPNVPVVVEDADTFAGNATKKSSELARWFTMVMPGGDQPWPDLVLADDSGLEVDVLRGAPGVHSARFAALDSAHPGNSSDTENSAKLLRLLKDVPLEKRTARFHCAIALTPVLRDRIESASPVCYADELAMQTQTFDGVCEGRIGFDPRGTNGFGYDPLFVPKGFDQTFAELSEELKNRLSHRARALAKLKAALDA